jgi:Ca2+/Na+ antiporter
MESSVPAGKSQTEPPPNRWGELFGSAIAIFTLVLPVTAIVYYSPATSIQALPTLPQTIDSTERSSANNLDEDIEIVS